MPKAKSEKKVKKQTILAIILMVIVLADFSWAETTNNEIHIYVDGTTGNDRNAGKINNPLKTINAAVKRLPRTINKFVTIHIAAGNYRTTGGMGLDAERLELNRPMHKNARVRIVGNTVDFDQPAGAGSVLLNWQTQSRDFLIVATQGHWTLENIQVGSRQSGQRRGIAVTGPAMLELRDDRIHTIGQKGPGICARYGGRIHLFGNIELNDDLCKSGGNEQSGYRA